MGSKIKIIFVVLLLLAVMMPSAGHAQFEGHPTISILTLDDRPPNYLFLKQLGAIAGIELEIEFGARESCAADCVSLNAASCGSLVESRTADPWTLTPPEVRPDALLHFAVPRVQPTVTDAENLRNITMLFPSLTQPKIQREAIRFILDAEYRTENEYLQDYADRIVGWLDFLERGNYRPRTRILITLDDNRPGRCRTR